MNSIYGTTIIKPVETDTIMKDSRDYFEKYVSLNYTYIDSVLESNGRYYIRKICLILIMFTVGLKSYPCVTGL